MSPAYYIKINHTMSYSLKRRLERLGRERWTRQSLRTLLRSVWIGLSIICIGLGLVLLFDFTIPVMVYVLLAVGCLGIGVILLLRRPMKPEAVARRLDKRFGLNQQLSTALEVAENRNAEGVETYLLESAGYTTGQIHKYVVRNRRWPWGEAIAVIALLLLSAGLLLLLGLNSINNTATAEPLPPLNAPQDPAAQNPPPDQANTPPNDPNQGGGQDNQSLVQTEGGGTTQQPTIDEESARALADALRDQSATRPAADALDQGNIDEAAQSLRELADRADELSPETRRDLSNELRDAASEIERNNPELAEQVRESAYGLQQEGQSTADALENLADAIEQLEQVQQGEQQAQGEQGQQDQSQQDGGSSSGIGDSEGEQRTQPHERLGVDGVPLELESEGEGQDADGDPDTATSAGGGSFEASGPEEVSDETVQVEADPLQIPAELRDVVQEYFSPAE